MALSKSQRLWIGLAGFATVLGCWWLVTAFGSIEPFFLPKPTAVGSELVTLFTQEQFLSDIGVSVMRILIGFGLATMIALPIGIWMGMNHAAEATFEPLIDFIRYTPIPAFIPLFILWFGIGELEKIVVIVAAVFFQLVLMIAASVSRVPRALIESSRTLGASFEQITRLVVIPYALPTIIDDLRISMGWAWSGVMLAEIVGSTAGIGYVIIQAQRLLQTETVIAAIVVVGALGVVTDLAFKSFQRAAYPWYAPDDRHA